MKQHEQEELERLQLNSQKLQNKVDRLKTVGLVSNIHNLTPPTQKTEDSSRDIALVGALSVTPRIQEKFLEIRGLEYDTKTKTYVQITEPIMNILGAYRFCKLLKMAQEIEWASYDEEEIKARIIHFFEENIVYFLFWNEEYDLNPRDFNYVITTLQVFIDSSFHKSKSGKYINTLGRTYDEGTLRRALETDSSSRTKKEEGFLAKHNPFRERR